MSVSATGIIISQAAGNKGNKQRCLTPKGECNSLTEKLTVTLANAQNHVFTIPVTAGRVATGLLLGGIGSTLISKNVLDAWKSAINNLLR